MVLKSNVLKSNTALITYRGDSVENQYRASIAVTDAEGNLLRWSGDPQRITLVRSAAKPMQTLAIMRTGATDTYSFSDEDIALMCASHSSEEQHIQRARKMMASVNATESQLQCGGHAPLSEQVNRQWIKADYIPTGICNNCSGKHAGMIAGAISLTRSADGYHLTGHPMQQLVIKTVSEVTDLASDAIQWATDGCNLPAPAFPLDKLAMAYARFSRAAVRDSQGGETCDEKLMARIFHAMAAHPEYVGGRQRFCTELMTVFRGQLIGKLGADACYAIGLSPSLSERAFGQAIATGIAVKVEDGNIEAMYSIIVEILSRLNILTEAQKEALTKFHYPPMLNTMGIVSGTRKFTFSLSAQ